MIIIVFGLPGSGKSYFARRLAAVLHAEYINSDILRRKMFHTRTYTEEEKEMVYDLMVDYMREAKTQNKNIVLDATFYKDRIRKKVTCETSVDGIILIEVWAEESLIKERLLKPREDSEADFEIYRKIKAEWESLSEPHLVLQSTNDNIKEMLQQTMDYLHRNDKRTNR